MKSAVSWTKATNPYGSANVYPVQHTAVDGWDLQASLPSQRGWSSGDLLWAKVIPRGSRKSSRNVRVICGPDRWEHFINTSVSENLVEDE